MKVFLQNSQISVNFSNVTKIFGYEEKDPDLQYDNAMYYHTYSKSMDKFKYRVFRNSVICCFILNQKTNTRYLEILLCFVDFLLLT